MNGKIALEEHVTFPGFEDLTPVGAIPPEFYASTEAVLRSLDARLEEMDATGVLAMVVSLTSPGIQAVADPPTAVRRARQANDALAGMLARDRSGRFYGFAAVALQDPPAAAGELERAVTQLGFKGALVNGYSNVGRSIEYGDAQRVLPFWEMAEALDVPVYLHPRQSAAGSAMFDGRDELAGPVWNFAVETATHAARLITGGIFDRFPKLNVILGHLGETLPHAGWRIEHWLERTGRADRLRHPFRHYLQTNHYFTTSGCFHTPTLHNVLREVGPERILFSVDYPYESLQQAAEWFHAAEIGSEDYRAIGYTNATSLLGLTR